jgi:putative hemolysin
VNRIDVALLAAGAVLLLLTLLLAAAETALGRVPAGRAQALADGDRRGEALRQLVTRPESYLTTLRLSLLAGRMIEATIVGVVFYRLAGLAGATIATLANLVVVLVVGEAMPRTWAALRAERTGLASARPVRRTTGFVPLRLAADALVRLANVLVPGRGLEKGPYLSEQEPRAVVEVGVDEGVIEQDERELIESIIDFGETVAREVMVPRPEMVTVNADFRVADVMEIMLLNGYSRVPACGEGIDDVVGLVYAKDLMRAERDGKESHAVDEFLRPATFVPETKRLRDLLREMQEQQFHMVVVLDEYGSTAGLVTLEDIIEELVGEIFDEYDVEDPMIQPLPGGDVLVRGRTPLDEVNELLNASLPEGDWDTVGGLVYTQLGHVPHEDESVVINGWTLSAERVQGRRIGRIRISPPRPQPDAGGVAGSGNRASSNGRRLKGDGGQAGAEALPLALLLFVVTVLLFVNIWSVVDAKLAVDAAAREATRSYVEAAVGDGGSGAAERSAVEAGSAALEAYGRDPGRARVWLSSLTSPGAGGGFVRCARATFSASYHVPALSLPWIGGFGQGFDAVSSHSELIDPYRDGVPGGSGC